ncbi:MAG: ABC transporter ATP-binding protein [Flavipsychrobacter sp.]
MISVKHVSKKFGAITAVNDISFEVREGENLILLGASGCGKTTTLRMINRLIVPDKGNIWIAGQDISNGATEELRRKIGYVLQHNALFPHYTVAENIAIVPKLLKWDKKKIESRAVELIHKLRLPEECLHKYPSSLSGGQQQRVNVARAIAAYPPLLLMDEPFGALDPVTRSGIVNDFATIDEFKKKTIVMVTHDVPEAFELGDRICLMDKGQIVQIGTPSELLFNPANEQVKAFFDGHYLELALKATSIHTIWPFLAKNIITANDEVIFPATHNLWEIIELMTKNRLSELPIKNDITNEVKQLSLTDIFTAFSAYKNS